MEYDKFTGGLEEDEFTGGWIPKDYLAGDFADGVPLDYHKRKNGRCYMDISDWANRKWTEQAERDPALEKIYLSAKMMKWHPLTTKDLRKAYGLLASAAMRAMSPDYKFMVKRKTNKANTAMKLMREEMKHAKAKYGPIAKRNIATRANFWNYLAKDVRVTDPDVFAILTGYAKDSFTSCSWYRYCDGALGRAASYDNYKVIMERKREERLKQMLMHTRGETCPQSKEKVLNAGRKAAREAIKAEKERLMTGEKTIWNEYLQRKEA